MRTNKQNRREIFAMLEHWAIRFGILENHLKLGQEEPHRDDDLRGGRNRVERLLLPIVWFI